MNWSDEFDGAPGSAPNPEFWQHELGGGGWGDHQLQTYTADVANASITAEGYLAITARREASGTITSARLITKGRVEVSHGRVEARMRVPSGAGVWPAFWMLGADIDEVGWPQCGEIDVMEFVGSEPRTVHGTAHGPGFAGVGGGIGAAYDGGVDLSREFHVYAMDWDAERVSWLLDDIQYFCVKLADLPVDVFGHGFYLLLNLAVGGSWPGNAAVPSLPATMLVDWVRVSAP